MEIFEYQLATKFSFQADFPTSINYTNLTRQAACHARKL